MWLDSALSATARPFQPQATLPSALVDNTPQDYSARNGLTRGSPITGFTAGSPVRRAPPNHRYTPRDESVSSDNAVSKKSLHRRRGGRGS